MMSNAMIAFLSMRRRIRFEQGQATVEMVVVSLFLVPLFLIVPLLGKYLDIAEATIVASRYVAFEGITHHEGNGVGWKTDAALAQEVHKRFFSNAAAALKTNDSAGNFNADRNALWFDHAGNPLLPDFQNNVVVRSERDSLAQPFGAAFRGEFGLNDDNLNTGHVRVSVADIPRLQPFDTLGLTINRHVTVLVDPWSASGSNQVRSRIQDSGLAYPYQPLEVAKTAAEPFLQLFEYGASPPKIGRVDPDFVPKDRVLQPYR